jgi:CO/xanthine dehydrogenase Mo-binding subunit/xanthine dehydrogenase iron-sulfur cluster and FAD-binding subunit A
MKLVVNGAEWDGEVGPLTMLLDLLRDRLGLTGAKEGCGRGECGACTVLVGETPMLACVTLAALVRQPVTTVEGLGEEASALREAFADCGAFQCGFCTSGQLVQALALIREGLPCDRWEAERAIRHRMSGNICRCTGYAGIIDAILRAASPEQRIQPGVSQIGRRTRPIEWRQQTLGTFRYSGDVERPGMLHARILRSPHAHARIVSIDTEAARACPGVAAIITAADFAAGIRYIHEGAADRPPMADGVVRFVGQEIAAVAAATRAQADAALRAIRVRYEFLSAPLTIDAALKPGAARLHERKGDNPANVAIKVRRQWGDYAGGLAASRHSVGGTFWYPPQFHNCMEPGVTMAEWSAEEEKLYLWTSTAAPFYIVREVSHILGLEKSQVVCQEIGVGGSFGARSKVAEYEVIAGALSRKTGRPLRLALTREEDMAATKTRHGFRVSLRLHGDAIGKLRALDGTVLVDNGAYSHSGGSVMGAGIKGLGTQYAPDGMDVTGMLIDTAKQPGGQFRGYGTTQTSFALECLMDELAEATGLDPVEIRLRNANRPGTVALVGAKIGSSRLAECLQAARDAIGWSREKAAARPGRGVGIAAGVHVSGSYVEPGANRSDCAIDIFTDSGVRLRFGGADSGTGQKTILAQIAAEELGVPVDRIAVLSMDSTRTPFDMGAWSSRGTHYTGHAARQTAVAAAARLRELARGELGDGPIELAGGFARNSIGSVAIGDLVRRSETGNDGVLTVETSFTESSVELSDKTGRGNISASYNFAAHAALVEVERRTGAVNVLDYVAAHDVGTALNPTMVEGQIVGGVAMGLGSALGEEAIHEQGRTVNPSFLNYAQPRAADLPRIRPIIVGGVDPHGPYGAKAVGEMGINPPAAVIANAVYDAVGVRIRELPITPDKILGALREKSGLRRKFGVWRRPHRWWVALMRQAYRHGLFQILHRRMMRRYRQPEPSVLESLEVPENLTELRTALAAGAAPIGGGTDIHLRRRLGLPSSPRLAAIAGVMELATVAPTEDGGIDIGAGVTLADLERAVRGLVPAITDAIDRIASPQIRAVATLGGNLVQANRCWFLRNGFDCYKRRGGLAPCYAILGDHRFYHAAIDGDRCQSVTPSDMATVLVGLDAVAVTVLPGLDVPRRIPMVDFYTGPGETVLHPGELLTHIHIPAPALGLAMAFQKLRLWEGDFAVVSVMLAAQIGPDGCWRDIRLCLGGVSPTPRRATATEVTLEGRQVTPALLRQALDRELDATAHPLAHNGWKLDAVAGLAEKTVEQIVAAG